MNTSETQHRQEHERLIESLGAYVDGELAPEQAAVLEAHLLGCQRCRQELSLQRAMRTRLEYQEMQRAPAALRERIRTALEAEDAEAWPRHSHKQYRWSVLLPWAGWALAACLALVIGLQLGLSHNPGPQPVPMIAAAIANYHQQLAGELPAADTVSLSKLKRSLPFPVTPIAGLRSHMISAWSLRIRGQPAAALAYRLDGQVIVQYVVSESLFFRQPQVREAVAAHGLYVVSVGRNSVVARPGADNGSLLIGSVPVSELESISMQERTL